MGKRYYCDYCDRSFKDDPEARKRHLSSLQHAKNHADHYRQFEDPEEILRKESLKIPCKKVATAEGCPFGINCRFSHYSPPMMWELQRIVALKNWKKTQESTSNIPNSVEVINEYFKNSLTPITTEIMDDSYWEIPAELQNYSNLPPSMWPITPASVTDSNFAKWG